MKKLIFTVNIMLVVVALCVTSGCIFRENIQGSSIPASREVSFVNVNKVKVMSGIGRFIITHDKEKGENLMIEADDNILPYILTEVSNNELDIKLKGNVQIRPSVPLVFRANLKDGTEIGISAGVVLEMTSEAVSDASSIG